MVDPCPLLNRTICTINTMLYFFSGDLTEMCDNSCPLECDSVTYTTSVSSVRYPSNMHAKRLIQNDWLKFKIGNENLTIDELRSNILSLNVHYSSLSYQSFTEYPKTQLVDLISNIGGTLGLFLGVSFLSFIEILDLAACLAFNFHYRTNLTSPKTHPMGNSMFGPAPGFGKQQFSTLNPNQNPNPTFSITEFDRSLTVVDLDSSSSSTTKH